MNNETTTHILRLIDEIITYYGILKIVLQDVVSRKSRDKNGLALEDDKLTTLEKSKREHSKTSKRCERTL